MRCNLFTVDIWRFQFPDVRYLDQLRDPALLDTVGLGRLDYISPNLLTGARSWEHMPGNDRLHDREIFWPVRDFIQEKSLEVWRELDYYRDQVPDIYQSWVTVAGPGAFALPHVHYNTALTAVVYITAETDQGNIVFENPMDQALGSAPMSRKTERMRQEISVKTGDTLIFPGWLRHYTIANKTDRARVSFIANMNGVANLETPP